MMEKKTGLTFNDISERVPVTVITLGGEGSEIHLNGERFRIPIATAEPMVGPTGGEMPTEPDCWRAYCWTRNRR
jgi:adenosine kinase